MAKSTFTVVALRAPDLGLNHLACHR